MYVYVEYNTVFSLSSNTFSLRMEVYGGEIVRSSYVIGFIIAATLLSGCKWFDDFFVFREEQKPLVAPPPVNFSTMKPQRMQPPLPIGDHYSIR